MNLLIDRMPLQRWVDRTRTAPVEHWSVRLPVLLSPPSAAPSPGAPPQTWVLDTGFTGDAFAWRHHLEIGGLDPDADRDAPVSLRSSATSGLSQLPVRRADIWLASNLHHPPFPLSLGPGIIFRDQRVAAPDPEFHRALLGMRPLIRAGLKVELDFAGRTVSVWTP